MLIPAVKVPAFVPQLFFPLDLPHSFGNVSPPDPVSLGKIDLLFLDLPRRFGNVSHPDPFSPGKVDLLFLDLPQKTLSTFTSRP